MRSPRNVDPVGGNGLRGLRTVIHPSIDLAADKESWTDLLGQQPHFNQPFYMGFNVGGYDFALLPGAEPSDGALVYWGVEDVAPAVEAPIERGSVEHTPIADVGDDTCYCYVLTPAGTILRLTYNPNFRIGETGSRTRVEPLGSRLTGADHHRSGAQSVRTIGLRHW